MKKSIILFLLTLVILSCEKKVYYLPTLSIKPATSITETAASLSINITNDGGAVITEKGLYFGESYDPEISGIKVLFTSSDGNSKVLQDLTPYTNYYVKGFATNNIGITYTNQIQFTTLSKPSITTNPATLITHISAALGGNIVSIGSAQTTEQGIYLGTSSNPETTGAKLEIDIPLNPFSKAITELLSNTTYYFKAYAINNVGEALGNELSFTTLEPPSYEIGTVNDIDGNTYNTVKIGDQWWMAENLKTTTYSDGTSIPLVTDNSSWKNLVTPGFCYFENDEGTYKDTYGNLYNWYAVNTGKLCPSGWHVPTDAEWTQLTDFLGGESVAGGKMKEIGLEHWGYPNAGATNESGFTALPAGYRQETGNFYTYNAVWGFWWTSTEYNSLFSSYARYAWWDQPTITRYTYYKKFGFSVRCVKD